MSDALSTEAIYSKLPVFMQNIACWYYGKKESRLRFNDLFHRLLAELLESEKFSRSDIEEYQNEKLRELIAHAYENVPYYREVMDNLRLVPADIRTREDLPKLPLLTKELVRQNSDKLISRITDKRELQYKHTGGTTGTSLHFYSGKAVTAFQWALWWRHRKRFGLELGDLHVNFTGKLVVPPEQRSRIYWRWNSPMGQALINMHHLTPEKIGDIVGFLNEHAFAYYSGYPSIIHVLAITARDAKLKLNAPPRVIVTGAENVLEYQRRDISEFTGAILTDQYGFTEACGNASQCPQFVYHEDFEFGIIECFQPQALGHGRTEGKLICTGFANPEVPFIRYEVGDIGTWEDPAKQCLCGRESRVLTKIVGRVDDYVITPENRRIMRFDYIFKDTSEIKESQILQDEVGAIKVRIVKRPAYSARDEEFVRSEIRKWISSSLLVKFEYVSAIEREANGKFRAVKSLLK